MPNRPRIAIACQGGGSHAAFGAGVLRRLLAPDYRGRFELAALSGTSGGAMCAALVWAGLIRLGGGPGSLAITTALLGLQTLALQTMIQVVYPV